MTKKLYEIEVANLEGEEETFYILKKKQDRNKLQIMAREERSIEEIINEGDELPTLKSLCFGLFQ